ncbi:hypothetical protein FPY71_07295 [Aureimonas fodinaquatilis]|uniref:Uncharacterized protein n=1 Tax=Aureimonas fodinaquatilis TaxID=2565783 RepID=A0A5B0DWE2_9HYPH|nr:hypothetical protein [Aureimonas fodinaquatilis]KAA0970322.1 hypothetical protein FPY71_07295 [Aureimonas fodinaquatilis]
MGFLLVIGVALWFWLGDPAKTVANWFWTESSAPWEQVDAYLYPSRSDLTVFKSFDDVGSVEACRSVVYNAASAFYKDPRLLNGDYECGVGPQAHPVFGKVYRVTVK